VNSTILTDLEPSVPYLFIVYSGTEQGYDVSEGANAILSTDSSFFSSTFYYF